MKAIIYAGIGLFSAASVYGVVDYYSTQKKGTLDKLYKEPQEVVVTETPVVVDNPAPVDVSKTNVVNKVAVSKAVKKIKRRRRTISLDDFSRSRIPDRVVIEAEKPVAPVKEEPKKDQ